MVKIFYRNGMIRCVWSDLILLCSPNRNAMYAFTIWSQILRVTDSLCCPFGKQTTLKIAIIMEIQHNRPCTAAYKANQLACVLIIFMWNLMEITYTSRVESSRRHWTLTTTGRCQNNVNPNDENSIKIIQKQHIYHVSTPNNHNM